MCVQVLKTPAALAYHGVGPMVSARVHDLHILWNRTFQLFDLCTKVCLPHALAGHGDVVNLLCLTWLTWMYIRIRFYRQLLNVVCS